MGVTVAAITAEVIMVCTVEIIVVITVITVEIIMVITVEIIKVFGGVFLTGVKAGDYYGYPYCYGPHFSFLIRNGWQQPLSEMFMAGLPLSFFLPGRDINQPIYLPGLPTHQELLNRSGQHDYHWNNQNGRHSYPEIRTPQAVPTLYVTPSINTGGASTEPPTEAACKSG